MKIRKFFEDFIGSFLHFIYIGLLMLTHLAFHILNTLFLFIKNVIAPMFTELLADLNMLTNIFMQSVYSIMSSFSLLLSKSFYYMSRYYHERSEKIIHKTWEYR